MKKKDVEFKRIWQKQVKGKSEEDIVFGSVLRTKWSRDSDVDAFTELEISLGLNREQDLILDIGCGPLARAEVQYSLKGFVIVGLDISPTTLKKAKSNLQKYGKVEAVEYVLADAECLPFHMNNFDTILCIGTIAHLPNVKSVVNTIKEMKRTLKPNGTVYITFWLNLYSFFGIQHVITMKILDFFQFSRAQQLIFRGLKEINNIFTCCGLKITRICYGNLMRPPWIMHFAPNFVIKIINKITFVINEAHKKNPRFSRFSVTFEVTGKKIPLTHNQSVKADDYHQFLN